MQKKDFSFKYDIKTKTGEIIQNDKYIKLNTNEVSRFGSSYSSGSEKSCTSSSSGISGYGLNLLRRKK